MGNLRITMGKGFQITFENGVTISVQFGRGNYCDNYNKEDTIFYPGMRSNGYSGDVSSSDCEIAIWDSNDVWITSTAHQEIFGEQLNDDVAGRVSVEDMFKYMTWAQNKENSHHV